MSPVLDVGVIVPVYNRARTVLETLDSIVAQSRPPRRLVIVDDGSTDGTPAAVGRWKDRQAEFPRIDLIQQENAGAGAARNHGIRLTDDCRYLAFLDSDDLWPVDFLERTVSRLQGRDEAVAASTDCLRWDCGTGRRHRKRYQALARRQRATEQIFRSNHQGQATVFQGRLVRQLQGFNAQLPTGQDLDFYLRISLMGPWLHVCGAPVIYRLGYAASPCEQHNLSRRFEDRYRKWTQIREHFLETEPASRKWVGNSVAAKVLGSGWYKAGCELQRCGREDEAEACFRRALLWRPALRTRLWVRQWRAKWLQPRCAPSSDGD